MLHPLRRFADCVCKNALPYYSFVHCCYKTNGMKNLLSIALLSLGVTTQYDAKAQTEVTYYTSMGDFKVMLTDTLTPITVDSFLSRVNAKFYDGLIFHRVIDGFMIQGGDPLGTGFGGPGYQTPDEFHATLKNVPGALAMANSGPNTNGSQFYINLVTNSHLNNHYTVFGKVTTNFTVVQSIGHVTTDTDDRPLTNVVMDSIRVTSIPTPASIRNAKNVVPYISIYPNPSRGLFTIELPAIATDVEVVNVAGQVVYSAKASGRMVVDLQGQAAGMYTVRLSNADSVWERKVVAIE